MKKFLAVLLALSLSVSLYGCRKNGGTDTSTDESDYSSTTISDVSENTDSGNSSASSSASSNTSSGSKGGTASDTVKNTNIDLGVKVPKGEYDFGGKTVTIAVWDDNVEPKLGKSALDDAKYYAMHYTMQKYNIGSIVYKKMASGSSAYNTTFIKYAAAGDVWGDIMLAHSDYVKSYIQQGLIQNIKDKAGKLNSNYYNTNVCSVGSGDYGFYPKSAINLREAYLIYNTDLIKRNNLTDPQTLYNNKQWTYKKYQEYARTITDVNKDVYGMAIPNFHQLFNAPELSSIYKDGSKYKSSFAGGPYKANIDKLYNWIIEMYNEGSVLGDFAIGQEALDQSRDSFRNGKVGFIFGGNTLCKQFKSEGMKNYKVVAAPTENGEHKYYNMSAHYSFYSLPAKKTKYSTEQLLAVANDLFCTSDSSHGKAYYKVNETEYAEQLYAEYFTSLNDAKYIINLGKDTTSWYGYGIFVNESFQVAREMLQPVLQGKSTWAKVVAQYSSQHQSDLDKSLNSGLYK